MKFGLTAAEYQYIIEKVVEPLEAHGAKVWCYGSRARGDFKKYSDLDLMIDAKTDISSLLAEIRENLQNGNFPYKVDLVNLEDFAESYRPGFEKDRKPFL